MYKIIFAGIGGVGGFFGGLAARRYETDSNVSVYFVARGENLRQIRENGLRVIKGDQMFTARPKLAADQPGEIGQADFIIVCTKSYDLESVVEQLKPCIGNRTVIVPLLNGADITERIKTLLPEATVWQGCVYIVSSLTAPGQVECSGNVQNLFFGADGSDDERLSQFEKLLKEAGINAFYSRNMKRIIWEKFIFISTTATLTCYYDTGFADIVGDETKRRMLLDLIDEAESVARAVGAGVEKNMKDDILGRLEALSGGITSSMHRDFRARKNTELSSLTGMIVRSGKEHGIATPCYDMIYSALRKKTGEE